MNRKLVAESAAKHKCPPHHFVIDSDNVGHCKDCPEVRDYEKLLQKDGHLIKLKSELGNHRKRNKAIYGHGKRGRPPKYA